MGEKFKKSMSLVLTALSTSTLATPQSEVHAWHWYDFLWYLMPTSWWNCLFLDQNKMIKLNKEEEGGKKGNGVSQDVLNAGNGKKFEDTKQSKKGGKSIIKYEKVSRNVLFNAKDVKAKEEKSQIIIDNNEKKDYLANSPKDEEIEKQIKDLIYKKCSKKYPDGKERSANEIYINEIYKTLSPNLNEVKENFNRSVNINLENVVENTYGNKIESVIKRKECIGQNREKAIDILIDLQNEVSGNRTGPYSALVIAPVIGEKGTYKDFNFSLNLFSNKEQDGVFCKKFAKITVKEDRIVVSRFIDKVNIKEVEILSEKISDNLVKVDTFEEILLGEEGAIEKVNALAEKIRKINSLFVNLYKICKKLDVSAEKKNLSASFNFDKNKSNRIHIAPGENSVERYVSSITIGDKTEEIKVFYREINEINEIDAGVLEYNLTKSEDINSLAEIFSEETVERIVFANSSEESEKREGNGSKKVLEKYKKLEESSSYDEFE